LYTTIDPREFIVKKVDQTVVLVQQSIKQVSIVYTCCTREFITQTVELWNRWIRLSC